MTTMTTAQVTRRVATYERVSSEDQRDRETIKTQTDVLAKDLADDPGVILVDRYVDDGVSGTIPLAERPAGGRLMRDAAAGRFDEVRVYKFDRLGRDAPDLLKVGRALRDASVDLRSVVEGAPDLFMWDILSVVADNERRTFLRKTADGMDRAAREGRYTGGVVAYGLRVEGLKPNARLVVDDGVVWGDWSAADVIRWMYERIALDDWSCKQVADELDARGVPTHSMLDGTGTRKKGTRGIWRRGRIGNMIVNELYRGESRFGQRTKKDREAISAEVPALVSPGLWQAAQDTLARHRICARNTKRVNLLKGVISCGLCGLNYISSQSSGKTWYRCNGQLTERGAIEGRCPSRSIKGEFLEPVIWQDIERFLRHPGDLLDELDGHAEREAEAAHLRAEADSLRRRIEGLADERREMLRQRSRGRITDGELDDELARIDAERDRLDSRLEVLTPPDLETTSIGTDLIDDIRARLDGGLTDQQKQEITRLLVGRITISTTINEDGSKDAKAMIDYSFPAVVETRTARVHGGDEIGRLALVCACGGRRRRLKLSRATRGLESRAE